MSCDGHLTAKCRPETQKASSKQAFCVGMLRVHILPIDDKESSPSLSSSRQLYPSKGATSSRIVGSISTAQLAIFW
jgi:hypothetical protein